MKKILIAEVKTKSPFGYSSDKSWYELFEVAQQYGDWVSIHTDERWGGNIELIKKAKEHTDRQILAKGIHQKDEDIDACLKMGADYVLVVGRIPDKKYWDKILVEPNDLEQLRNVPQEIKVVWNKRDLNTGEQKKETFEQARKIFKGWMCQASMIKSKDDVEETAEALLIGEHLEKYLKSIYCT